MANNNTGDIDRMASRENRRVNLGKDLGAKEEEEDTRNQPHSYTESHKVRSEKRVYRIMTELQREKVNRKLYVMKSRLVQDLTF